MSALTTTYRPVALNCKDGPLLASDSELCCLALFYAVAGVSVSSATISPNPTDINAKFRISVFVDENTIYVEPEVWYSGEVYAGEV